MARLAGTAVFDPNGDPVGKVRDVVVMVKANRSAPRVHGLVVEVPPHRRIFLPMTRITGVESGQVIATGVVNLRRFAPRRGETLVLAELLDSKVTLTQSGQQVTLLDVGIEQGRGKDWAVTRLFVRKPGKTGFRRRGETMTVNWDAVADFRADQPGQGVEALLDSLDALRPADVADILRELPLKRRLEVVRGLDDERLADVLEELPEADQITILDVLENERAADILEEMDPDDAADLLGDLPPERARELLALVEPEEARDLRRLLVYDDFSAGGMMTTAPIVLAPDATVAEALAQMRNPEHAPSLAAQVFVARPPLETPTGRFLGVVHFQNLLREFPSALVSGLIDPDVESVRPDAPLDEVTRSFATYNLVALPVVDEHDHLLGAVTVDDVIDHMLPPDWRQRRREDTAPAGPPPEVTGQRALITRDAPGGGDG